MPFTAEAEQVVPLPVELAFARFIDYPRWADWMPPVFRPVRGPSRALREKDRLLMSISGLPTVIFVERIFPDREVCWSGGVPGVLWARHTFTFESRDAQATLIRSIEPWSGVLTSIAPVSKALLRAAERGGRDQLDGFARWIAGGASASPSPST